MTCDAVIPPNFLIPQNRLKDQRTALIVAVWLGQERPCTRCIKRDIGHLCHDEPREPPAKKSKTEHEHMGSEETLSPENLFAASHGLPAPPLQEISSHGSVHDANIGLRPSSVEDLPASSQRTTKQGQNLNGTQSSQHTQPIHCYFF
jgi:hypothetical protein